MTKARIIKTSIVIIGALFNAVAFNLFLIPADVFSSGFAGIAQLTSSIVNDFTPFSISTGLVLLLLNIPIAILGWRHLGKSFTLYSFFSVILLALFMWKMPIYAVAEDDILLNAVFGGVLSAIGVGMTLKWGASTGGMDVIVMILSRLKDRPAGTYYLILNGGIITASGALYDWQTALYTLVALYAATRVIDTIHTRHIKLTAMIITSKPEQLEVALREKLSRGITKIPAKGSYSNENKEMLLIVITRYELFNLKKVLSETDPNAFTNIVQTTGIFGFFRKESRLD
ncbi:YitT family protein [Chengkuizengella axinellae]|uniref:YitT family protein n=1 Tax=Chengkuizengella axinellae TaxID=3064388 RepID=A0ABT9J1N1_9BACL|nr:YitT family protein [Chengkuizengella sp. 2205SS18-9]MDP5275526.1 YitT family protein [Chengkuizengella sp. 2205SS18-9]